jgi:hypothetical protein
LGNTRAATAMLEKILSICPDNEEIASPVIFLIVQPI